MQSEINYKFKGKLSRWKEVNDTFLPDSEIFYMHISDIKMLSKAGSLIRQKASQFLL